MDLQVDNACVDQQGPDYDLVCPSCSKRCVGRTYANGTRGTYLEAYTRFDVRQITCRHCGYFKKANRKTSLRYRLWFRIRLGTDVVWAENELRLRCIRDQLASHHDPSRLVLHNFPKRLLTMRKKAVVKIDNLLAKPSLIGTRDPRVRSQH